MFISLVPSNIPAAEKCWANLIGRPHVAELYGLFDSFDWPTLVFSIIQATYSDGAPHEARVVTKLRPCAAPRRGYDDS